MSSTQTYKGSCHCGAVQFSANMSLEKTITCNCSMCKRAGYILAFIPASAFTLISGEEVLSNYQFNKKVIDHLFCRVCGIKPFGRGKDEQGNKTIAVNVRCLDGVDLSTLTPFEYDGANA